LAASMSAGGLGRERVDEVTSAWATAPLEHEATAATNARERKSRGIGS
jgi:hypothetical protein